MSINAIITNVEITEDGITQGLADYDGGRLSAITLRSLISLMRNERDALRAQLKQAESDRDKLVGQLNDLINDSHGVIGLHLNGDEAPWEWLIENEWLSALAEIEKD